MIDRVAASLDQPMVEVPVGFKWFVPGLIDGSFGFGGEESAGASFLRRDGSTWTTDKDGLILCLLASEILAVSGNSPSEHYAELVESHGDPAYARVDAPADREQKASSPRSSPDDVPATTLAGEEITAKLTEAPGNGAKIGGLKVVTENAWFAARPSGTEDVYKIYAESFHGRTTSPRSRRRRARWSRLRWAEGQRWSPHSDSGASWMTPRSLVGVTRSSRAMSVSASTDGSWSMLAAATVYGSVDPDPRAS